MIEYLFKMAEAYQLPFAIEHAWFANDAAALAHVPALAAAYPLAATITVAIAPRIVERVIVNWPIATDMALRAVLQSRALIAASRELLAEPAGRDGGSGS